MHWVRVGEIDLLECDACDGTWIEAGAFDALCAQRERQAAIMSGAKAQGTATAIPATGGQPIRYRPCPQCGKLMNRQNFARLSGAIVDTCSGHGTFLDRGELHQVVRFILDGGIDRMRQREIERLRDEQQRLRALELHLSRARGGREDLL